MPHPVLHRYHNNREQSDEQRDEPSPPSPALPNAAPDSPLIDLVDDPVPDLQGVHPVPVVSLDSPPPVRPVQPTSVVDLVGDDHEPEHELGASADAQHLQPLMTATDLDDLFEEDPSSPPTQPHVPNPARDVSGSSSGFRNRPPVEAILEADAWRGAVQCEAKMVYEHFQPAQGTHTEYSCAVMPITALLRVMQAVGTFIGATNSVVEGPIGRLVKLERHSTAADLPDFQLFQSTVNKILDEIIVEDVLAREAKNRREQKARLRKEARQREAEIRQKERRRAARATAEREAKKKRVEAIAQAKVRKRIRRSSPTKSKAFKKRSISKPSASRIRLISFSDEVVPSRMAAHEAERDIIRSLEDSEGSSDEDIPRRNTRSFARKQCRIYEREKNKMLGPGANIDDLRRHSYIMQIWMAKEKGGVIRRKQVQNFNSLDPFEDEISLVFPPQPVRPAVDKDEIQKVYEIQPVRKRRRVEAPVEISDDEVQLVEKVHEEPSPRSRPPKKPAMVSKAFQPKPPKPDVPPQYLKVLTEKIKDLEWGDMGDNFTVLGKRQRWEMDRPSVMDRLAQKTPFVFEEYVETQKQKLKIKHLDNLQKRKQAAAERKAAVPTPKSQEGSGQDDKVKRQQVDATKVDVIDVEPEKKGESDKQRRERKALHKIQIAQKLRERGAQTSPTTHRLNALESRGSARNEVSNLNTWNHVQKTEKSKSNGDLSRTELRRLRRQEEDYREKEDPRHPEYVAKASASAAQKRDRVDLDRESEERRLARWLSQTRTTEAEREETKLQKNGEDKLHRHWSKRARRAQAREQTRRSFDSTKEGEEQKRKWNKYPERQRQQWNGRVTEEGKRDHSRSNWREKPSGSHATQPSPQARRESDRTRSRRDDLDKVYTQAFRDSEQSPRPQERIPRRNAPEPREEPDRNAQDPRLSERSTANGRHWNASRSGSGNGDRNERRIRRRRDNGRRNREDSRRGDVGRDSHRHPAPADNTRGYAAPDSQRERRWDGEATEGRNRRGRAGIGRGSNTASGANQIERSNKGFALLEKMGWREGEGLGKDRSGRTEPLKPKRRGNRSGLGG